MIKPADRLNIVSEYYFSKKLKEIDKMRTEGKDVINLGIGSPDLPPSDETIKALCQSSVLATNHAYQSYIGIPELRKAFADWYKKYYNVTLNPANEILPLIGSKEGIMHISMAYINKGDEVLVPNPGYPTYQSVSKLMEADLRFYDLKDENDWYPDFDQLEKEDLSRVKIMWINYPHMPTGAPATMELFEKVVDFARRKNILVVNDNPYSFILNDKPLSILSVAGAMDVALELNSLSKSHNMSGWRMGMLAGNAEIISNVLKVKTNMDSGIFRPLQIAANEALKAPDSWYEEVNKHYKSRRNIVFEIFDLIGAKYNTKQNGMFVWAKVTSTTQKAEQISEDILQNAHVFVTPGFIFGSNGEKYLRISLTSKPEVFEEARKRIKNYLDNKK